MSAIGFRWVRDERGTATLETALVSTILLGLALGIVEFGSAHNVVHTLTSLSREGANLAARGTSLDQSVGVVMTNGASIGLASRGGAIGSKIVVENGTPTIKAQATSSGYAGLSRLGVVGSGVTGLGSWGLTEGQILYVMEAFYDYAPVTPFGDLMGFTVPDVLYERAVF